MRAREDMSLQDLVRDDVLTRTDAIDNSFASLLDKVKDRSDLVSIRRDLELLRYRVSRHLVDLSVLQVQLSQERIQSARLRQELAKARS
jgi:hypothetical protein